ncbi:hypothetical protein INR49_019293, partial [Caranx melampygus]
AASCHRVLVFPGAACLLGLQDLNYRPAPYALWTSGPTSRQVPTGPDSQQNHLNMFFLLVVLLSGAVEEAASRGAVAFSLSQIISCCRPVQ